MKAVISRTYGNTETKGHFVAFDGHTKVLELATIELPITAIRKTYHASLRVSIGYHIL